MAQSMGQLLSSACTSMQSQPTQPDQRPLSSHQMHICVSKLTLMHDDTEQPAIERE